jgi:hypothetical protein
MIRAVGGPVAVRNMTQARVWNAAALDNTVGQSPVGGASQTPQTTPTLVKLPGKPSDLLLIFLLVVLFVYVERKEAIL